MAAREKRYRKPVEDSVRVRMVPEFADMVRGWHVMHARGWKYYGRKMGLEGMLLAILRDFLEQPEDVKTSILSRGLVKAEAMERAYHAEMARKEAAGIIEGKYPYNPTEKSASSAKAAASSPVRLEETGPDGPAVVLDHPHRPRKAVPKGDRPKRRA